MIGPARARTGARATRSRIARRLVTMLGLIAVLALPVVGAPPAGAVEVPPVFAATFGTPGTGTGQFDQPIGLARDVAGSLYVTDALNHRVQKFTAGGAFITAWGTYGIGDGQFNTPIGVAVDAAGFVYVSDTYNNRIEKFDGNGGFVAKWGTAGPGNGEFNHPRGVAVDGSGNVYVTDYNNHRVQKFTGAGAFVTTWGSLGAGDGQFYRPDGIAIDGSGNVYVADQFHDRVEKFTASGAFLGKWGSFGGQNGQFNFPAGVAVDTAGNVYVADSFGDRVEKFDASGAYLTKWGGTGAANGQLSRPNGLLTDPQGNVYVADTANYRVQRFAPAVVLTVTRAGTGSGTVTSSPAGISCGSTCFAGFGVGATVTLAATPNPGSLFTGWSGACAGTGPCVVTMDTAKAVTAGFVLDTYPLTVTKTGSGPGLVTSTPSRITCGTTCTGDFATGSTVTLAGTPDPGSMFLGWRGGCFGYVSCAVTMTGPKTVTAGFGPLVPSVVAAVGSAGTEGVMDGVLSGTGKANLHAVPSAPLTVPADGFCSAVTYGSTAGPGVVAAPNGSDAGRDALRDSVAATYPDPVSDTWAGCVDVARSGLPPRAVGPAGDNPSFEYYAFALDAVAWSSPSLQAPPMLTVAQIRDIYDCVVTDWSQVGGGTGPIQRALPPVGSDTRALFLAQVLGVPTTYPFPASATCPAVITVAESTGKALTVGANRDHYQQFIVPYASAAWVFQANRSSNPTLDLRNAVRVGGILRPAGDPVASGTSAFSIRWTGADWRLDDATIVGGRTVANATAVDGNDDTLSAAPGSFTPADVGSVVRGTIVNDGTTIVAVSADGSTATIFPTAADGGTASLLVGNPAVSEANTTLVSAAPLFPGVHYLFNVVDSGAPSYLDARARVGFADQPAGAKSQLCDGTRVGLIDSNGYLDLRPVTSPGGAVDTTCRRVTP